MRACVDPVCVRACMKPECVRARTHARTQRGYTNARTPSVRTHARTHARAHTRQGAARTRSARQVQELGACVHGRTAVSRPASTHAPGASTQARTHDNEQLHLSLRPGCDVVGNPWWGWLWARAVRFCLCLTLDLSSKPSGITTLHYASALACCLPSHAHKSRLSQRHFLQARQELQHKDDTET
jgi:hypothetical protein